MDETNLREHLYPGDHPRLSRSRIRGNVGRGYGAVRDAGLSESDLPVAPADSSGLGLRKSSRMSFGPNGQVRSARAQTRKAMPPSNSQAIDHSIGWKPGEFLSA